MKNLYTILFLSAILIGCNSNTKKPVNETANKYVPIEEAENDSEELNLFEPNKDFIIETMEIYQDVDSVEMNKRFETYKQLVTSREGATEDDINWYMVNIQHIDSVSKSVIELANQEKYEDIAYLLDSELANFWSHPSNNVNSIFQLHWVMVPLYMLICPSQEEYYEKVIDMWEMNKTSMEIFQLKTGKPHEYYNRVLHELSSFYNQVGNEEKKQEVDAILAEIESKE